MAHDGLKELQQVLTNLPEEHRAGLETWIKRFVVSCDTGWTVSQVRMNSVGANIQAGEKAKALVKLGAEVARLAAMIERVDILNPHDEKHVAMLAVILPKAKDAETVLQG